MMWRWIGLKTILILAGVAFGSGAMAQGDLAMCDGFPAGQETYACMCPPIAETSGAVWGSGPYTADSNICQAAAHIGAIGPEGGPVIAVSTGPQDSFAGSTANGIQTSTWGSYDNSFLFDFHQPEAVPVKSDEVQACAAFPDNLDIYTCSCTPQATAKGTFWGNDPYTIDSDLCIAARHSGIIDAAGGTVRALRVLGLDYYYGTLNNGVQSRESGPFGASVVFDRN